MNKDASDFMVLEYDRISTAYFGLREQTTEMFKAYLTLVGLPLTVLVAVLNVQGSQTLLSLTGLPDMVSALLLVVAVLGFLVTMTIVSMRMSMIQYARTINKVRAYFADCDAKHGDPDRLLREYLVLPTQDTKPSFFELGRSIFWQLLAIGALDGALAGIACHNLLGLLPWSSLTLGGLVCLLHVGVYCGVALQRNANWGSDRPDRVTEPVAAAREAQ